MDPTPEQKTLLLRHMGVRRKAHNWAVAQIKAGIDECNETGQAGAAPSLGGLRKQWNAEKRELCADPDTGRQWWPDLSKEAAANGINYAVPSYVALAMVTTGCLEVEARTSIELDGSGESHLRVTAASEVLDIMSLDGDLSPAEVCSEMWDESSDNNWGLGRGRGPECDLVGSEPRREVLREHGIARTESGGYRYEWLMMLHRLLFRPTTTMRSSSLCSTGS